MQSWHELFGDIIWENVYNQKVKNQPETKYAEFNFKIISGILATNSKLYKWKKSESKLCIYCHCHEHTAEHMLIECQHVYYLWQKLARYFNTPITWEIIVLGKMLTKSQNVIVTVICFAIYKKFIVDRNSQIREDSVSYVVRQLKCIHESYKHIPSKVALAMSINDVTELLNI